MFLQKNFAWNISFLGKLYTTIQNFIILPFLLTVFLWSIRYWRFTALGEGSSGSWRRVNLNFINVISPFNTTCWPRRVRKLIKCHGLDPKKWRWQFCFELWQYRFRQWCVLPCVTWQQQYSRLDPTRVVMYTCFMMMLLMQETETPLYLSFLLICTGCGFTEYRQKLISGFLCPKSKAALRKVWRLYKNLQYQTSIFLHFLVNKCFSKY